VLRHTCSPLRVVMPMDSKHIPVAYQFSSSKRRHRCSAHPE
jgi:hypothetical protein